MITTMTTEAFPGYFVTEQVEIVTYDDCIAIMDAAIAELLEDDDE